MLVSEYFNLSRRYIIRIYFDVLGQTVDDQHLS